MKQVVVIHGGTTFANYDDYLQFLAEKPVSIDRMSYKPMWKELLQGKLGDNYQVILPTMPNKTNARYAEWKLWFTNISKLFEDNCILIGHSMGAIFLAKYLSETKVRYKIKATILVATPYDDESDEDLSDFKLTKITDLFTAQAGKVTTINGEDDPVISHSDIQKYRNDLPGADFMTLPAPDHFVRTNFPELLQLIRAF